MVGRHGADMVLYNIVNYVAITGEWSKVYELIEQLFNIQSRRADGGY